MCMYVCVCVYVYVYMYMYVRIMDVHAGVHRCVHVCKRLPHMEIAPAAMAVFAASSLRVPVSVRCHKYNFEPSWQHCSAALKYQTRHSTTAPHQLSLATAVYNNCETF